MVTLRQVGDMAMGLYYQNYKADEEFFDLAHFKFLLAAKYAELINDEFKANKRENKMLTGFSWYEVSPSWLIEETTKATYDPDRKEYSIELKNNIFDFEFDAMSSGVQFVNMFGYDCGGNVVRITQKDLIGLCLMPRNSQLMYYVKGKNKIVFKNANCDLSKAKFDIQYIPAIDCENDDSEMQSEKVNDMIVEVLNLMFGAKNGNLVDMSNDSNPNKIPVKEVGVQQP